MEMLTVPKARNIDVERAEWVLEQTPEGWIVQCDGETLMTQRRKPRTFIDLNRAIARLKADIGIRTFKVRTMQ